MGPPPSNGFGVASFVLSIFWLFGLGSLLAVIFGVKARHRARRWGASSGLGTAGVVIGIIGLIGAVLFWLVVAGLVFNVVQQTEIHHEALGTTVTLSSSDEQDSGIARVTVFSVTAPFTSQDPTVTPDPGQEFAVADIEECAGPNGAPDGPDTENLELVVGGQTFQSAVIGNPRSPALDNVSSLTPNQCTRGYLPYEIAAGTTPTGLRYGQGADSFDRYQWNLPT
jgi:hypothetical protein